MGVHMAWNYTQNIIFGLPNSGIVSGFSLFKLDAAYREWWSLWNEFIQRMLRDRSKNRIRQTHMMSKSNYR